jgi:putative tryptophan/tyrosine transport system substrate-binding protein
VDRLPDLAAGLVQLRADVIVVGANAAVAAAKAVTQTIPIVIFLTADPVGSGLVASLARPGGNVTGLTTTAGPEIYGKQLQLLKDAFPRISRVAVLVSHAAPAYALVVREIETATRALGLQRHVMEIRNPGDFDNAFAAMTKAHANAIFIPADSMFYQYRTRLVRLAANTRLPAMWGLREQAGGWWSVGLCYRPK